MGCVYGVARLYGFRQPYVTAYNAVVANYSISAEYSRTGVDDHVVAYIGMALYALYRGAVHVGGEALCTKSNALIQLNTFILYSSWAMRYMLIASKPG